MIGVAPKPASSSPARIAATRPSIMSDGATMSAPASACETASRTSSASVASLSTSPVAVTTPQCPCDVYSHRHTSVITTRSGDASFSTRTARCTMPSGSYPSEPTSSFTAGSPNSSTAGIPSDRSSAASPASWSSDRWNCPGIDEISSRTPSPCFTKSGYTKSRGSSRVSRTSERRASVRRRRRKRANSAGNVRVTIKTSP